MQNANDFKVNLENILYGYYIKYNKLDELINIAFPNESQTDTIDIYIDLFDMLKPIYSRDIYSNKRFVIVSSIINLAAHFREYFRSRYRMNTRIFLVFGEDLTNNHRQFYQSFGNNAYKNTINFEKNNKFIHDQLEMVKILCAYIYDIYYIHRNSIFSIFVYDNIIKNSNNNLSLIISKSQYAYQLPALLDTVLFRPKKNKTGDVSFAITQSNVLFKYYNKINNEKVLDNFKKINPKLFSSALTMTGIPSYGINSIMNTSTMAKLLTNAIDNGKILNDYNHPQYLYNAIPELSKYIDYSNFVFRFQAIDLAYQAIIYKNMPESLDNSWYINLNDKENFQYINNKYFVDNPLNLNSL